MIPFLARRFLWALVIMWAVASITFVVSLKVGDPVAINLGPHASRHDRENFRHRYHLDRPVWYQYGRYLHGLVLHGDLGESYRLHRPVAVLIAERFPRTFLLGVMAITLELVLGVALGVLAAARRDTWTDTAVMTGSFVVMSTPTFLSGKALLLLLAYYAGLFPVGGYGITPTEHLYHAVLPALTLAITSMAFYARLARNDLVEVLQTEYIRTARAKGLPERTILFKHALRNALVPIVTSLGMSVGTLFAGAIVTEEIFAWPGLGRLAYDSIALQDVPTIVGTVLFGSFGILIGNLLSDLAYAALDPRIRRA